MARPIVPAGIEIVVTATQQGDERINVLHASANGNTPTDDELLTAATTVMNGYRTHVSNYSAAVIFGSVKATDISQAGGHSITVPFPANTVGTNNQNALPGHCAAVVSIRSTRGGRSGSGRVYMFGLTIGATAGNDILQPAYLTGVNTMWTDISGDMTLAGLPLCVFSRKLLALYPWQAHVIDNVVDSQRRRLHGRGR